jgi:hypothetical protein
MRLPILSARECPREDLEPHMGIFCSHLPVIKCATALIEIESNVVSANRYTFSSLDWIYHAIYWGMFVFKN